MTTVISRRAANGDANKLYREDRSVHDWYRFVLSFPPHLVREYLERFEITPGQRVLDPFCGTGTTLVESKKHGIAAIGIEMNPMAYLASRTKTDWTVDPDELVEHATHVASRAWEVLSRSGIDDVPALVNHHAEPASATLRTLRPEQQQLLLTDSISPRPLHKALVLLDLLQELGDPRFEAHEKLALAKALVYSASNLHFGPEVGVGPAKPDEAVITPWLANVRVMAGDLQTVCLRADVEADVLQADARLLDGTLPPQCIDAVITSPPYPNEKDYTRTTRLESVLLGFLHNRDDLRALKRGLVRSNTRGVYKGDADDRLVADYPEIQRIAAAIEERRVALGKTSGFERMYARVTKLYFGGMASHLAALRPILKPGAHLAYVVGDQASYLRVMIRTGQILADVAGRLGYEVVSIDLFRTRLATATREQLREEVVVLRWPSR